MSPLLTELGITLWITAGADSAARIEDVTTIPAKPRARKRYVLSPSRLDCDLAIHVFANEGEARAFGAGISLVNDDSLSTVIEHTYGSPYWLLLLVAEESDAADLTVYDRRADVTNDIPEQNTRS